MTVRVFFQQFEPHIRERFARALADAGDSANGLALELRDEPYEQSNWRTEFCVTPPSGPVRITWAGIASLWCCCQAAARMARRMFEGKRRGMQRLEVADDPAIRAGLNLFVLCQRLCRTDFPQEAADDGTWVDWAPRPEVSPTDPDSIVGNNFFYGALGWIMRHEIAHITLQHGIVVDSVRAENDADRQATEWYRGGRRADPDRELSAHPGQPELELEFRAIAIGIGLIWVAMFESLTGRSGTTHPPSAERIFRCMNLLCPREDTMAGEVLADIIQAWIDPQGNWAPQGYADARTALNDALERLYRMCIHCTVPLRDHPILHR